MYNLSACAKGAVLTEASTFGACIVGLGRIARSFTVDAKSGECRERFPPGITDPIDSGADVGVQGEVYNEYFRG